MEDDWDLHAVVRGCAALSSAAGNTGAASSGQNFSSISFQQDCNNYFHHHQDLFEAAAPARRESLADDQELHELYKPFIFKSSSESSQIVISPQNFRNIINSPLSVLRGLQQDLTSEQQQQKIVKQLPLQQTQIRQKLQPFCFANGSKNTTVSHNPTPRSKKRKNNMKRVCHVAAENLSSDVWSWRKYGQKPIKGSPYPRGYYRCSTSKGCLARKQVERNRSDPGMFIVTYTAEHNHPMPTHRNSLAGSTRQKPMAETPNSDDSGAKAPCTSELSPARSLSAATDKLESSWEDLVEAEDDDDLSVSKMELDEDFFVGLEDFTAPDSGDCASVDFSSKVEFSSWLSNSSTTIAGGG